MRGRYGLWPMWSNRCENVLECIILKWKKIWERGRDSSPPSPSRCFRRSTPRHWFFEKSNTWSSPSLRHCVHTAVHQFHFTPRSPSIIRSVTFHSVLKITQLHMTASRAYPSRCSDLLHSHQLSLHFRNSCAYRFSFVVLFTFGFAFCDK